MGSNTLISGVAAACRRGAEQPRVEQPVVSGYGVTWQHGSRPRPDALLTLDPKQRPSAPRRWAA